MNFLVILVIVFSTYLERSFGQSTYKAAVVEHTPKQEGNSEDIILGNIELYRTATNNAKRASGSLDIIVFPEYGITGLNAQNVPDQFAVEIPDNQTYPILDDQKVLRELSNLAEEHRVYLVINLLERARNDQNTSDIFYNTNLVFDKDGKIVAKYRKINLYQESKLTAGNETVTFRTDFGVTFGLFTCFDILFHKPAREIFGNHQVTDIVYPAAWLSALPFYSALSVQHGYVVANGVNLLAANLDHPKRGYGGSGVYLADGITAETYIGLEEQFKPITYEVTKISGRKSREICGSVSPFGFPGQTHQPPNITAFVTKKDFDTNTFKYRDVDLSKTNNVIDVCDGKFCCTFNITVQEANNNEIYKVVAFEGLTDLQGSSKYRRVRICSLLACKNDDHDSCGERVNGTTKFSKITISGNLPLENDTYYQPITLNFNLKPITDASFCSSTNDSGIHIESASTKPVDKLIAFGLYGISSAASFTSTLLVIFLVGVVKQIF